jgi:hypothetical protein
VDPARSEMMIRKKADHKFSVNIFESPFQSFVVIGSFSLPLFFVVTILSK